MKRNNQPPNEAEVLKGLIREAHEAIQALRAEEKRVSDVITAARRSYEERQEEFSNEIKDLIRDAVRKRIDGQVMHDLKGLHINLEKVYENLIANLTSLSSTWARQVLNGMRDFGLVSDVQVPQEDIRVALMSGVIPELVFRYSDGSTTLITKSSGKEQK